MRSRRAGPQPGASPRLGILRPEAPLELSVGALLGVGDHVKQAALGVPCLAQYAVQRAQGEAARFAHGMIVLAPAEGQARAPPANKRRCRARSSLRRQSCQCKEWDGGGAPRTFSSLPSRSSASICWRERPVRDAISSAGARTQSTFLAWLWCISPTSSMS